MWSALRLAIRAAIGLLMVTHLPAQQMEWDQLPPIPDHEGFAGPFAGVSGGALIVAGGANIQGDKWKEPFVKKWYDSIFVLDDPKANWRKAGKLPRPLGYGVSISTDDGLICLGGSDSKRHYASAFLLHMKGGALQRKTLPSLPMPCANACGALVGRTIYLAGGIETPQDTTALHKFWALDLDAQEPIWRELDPWPGPERMLAVAGALDGAFYLFSGTKLAADADGKPVREYLRDAYRYTSEQGWKRLSDLPRAAVAAPSPVPTIGTKLLVITGDDGLNVTFQPVEKHPGFPRNALSYDSSTDTWTVLDTVPISRATVPTVLWHDRVVFLNGEARPRVRTPEVWSLRLH
ncbi:Kelch repeat-containing protein [Chthoniobacter flavus Ellin428]|uniref:Kelch repeat-containing protein n=2 Tax=Chthoniobacter flavus TaxID=191863 RepID=B4D3M6_9BACT|nr:Kelch repeat-containing protein [Chthoniobacter flavus Ellin428]